MDYLKPNDFRQLKAFFVALKEGRFRTNSEQNSTTVILDGRPTPVNKAQSLKLLRSFPNLQGEQFKDDNFLIKYLSDPIKRNRILSQLTPAQQIELAKTIDQKPVATTGIQQTSSQEIPTEQTTAGEPAGTMAGESHRGGMPHFPSGFSGQPAIHNIPRTPSKPEIPKSEIVIANKSGVVTGLETPPSKIYIANKGGAVIGERSIAPKTGFKIPTSFKNFGSRMGTFFQRNVGKYLTVGRAATGIGALIGGFAGAGLTGGSSVGVLGGAVGGGILPSWFKSGGGGRFFGNLGNGAINSFSRLSNQISRPSLLKGASSKRIGLAFLGMFLLFAIGAGVIGGLIGGGGMPSGESGNVGIGTTAPQSSPVTNIPPGLVPTEKLAQILHWAGIVNNALEQPLPPDGSWDRMQANISNNGYTVIKQPGAPGSKYWCTYLVADSYNLAGIKGLSIGSHGLVRNMLSFWQNTPGYFYIPKGISALQSAKPGYTVFRINPGGYQLDHASILSYIDVDARGNGEIRTLDSNTYNHWESRIINGVETDRSFFAPIVGFGGVTE